MSKEVTFQAVTENLLGGFGMSCLIFILTLLFSIPLGLLVSFGSMNDWAPLKRLIKADGRGAILVKAFRPISFLVRIFVWIIRGTPLMLQLFIIFYVPGLLLDGIALDRFEATIIAFTINYACYFSEIFRGGIQGVPHGQTEAGLVLGMTKKQIFFKVTLLQMIKRILPPMSNEVITLIKDTSLARVINVAELIFLGQRYTSSNGLIWPLFYTGVFYLLFVGVLTLLFAHFERKLGYFKIQV